MIGSNSRLYDLLLFLAIGSPNCDTPRQILHCLLWKVELALIAHYLLQQQGGATLQKNIVKKKKSKANLLGYTLISMLLEENQKTDEINQFV